MKRTVSLLPLMGFALMTAAGCGATTDLGGAPPDPMDASSAPLADGAGNGVPGPAFPSDAADDGDAGDDADLGPDVGPYDLDGALPRGDDGAAPRDAADPSEDGGFDFPDGDVIEDAGTSD